MKNKKLLSLLLITLLLASCDVKNSSSEHSSSSSEEQISESSSSSSSTSSEESSSSSSSESSSSSSSSTSSSESILDTLPPISYVQVFAPSTYSHIYAWITKDGKTTELCNKWPGTTLKNYDSEWKTYDFPGYTELNVIFNTGSNQDQTADLTCSEAGYYWYYNGGLHMVPPGEEDSSGGTGQVPSIPSYQANSWKELA